MTRLIFKSYQTQNNKKKHCKITIPSQAHGVGRGNQNLVVAASRLSFGKLDGVAVGLPLLLGLEALADVHQDVLNQKINRKQKGSQMGMRDLKLRECLRLVLGVLPLHEVLVAGNRDELVLNIK